MRYLDQLYVTKNGVHSVKIQENEFFPTHSLIDRPAEKYNACHLEKGKSANLFLKVVDSLVGIYCSTYLCCTLSRYVKSAHTSVAKHTFIST